MSLPRVGCVATAMIVLVAVGCHRSDGPGTALGLADRCTAAGSLLYRFLALLVATVIAKALNLFGTAPSDAKPKTQQTSALSAFMEAEKARKEKLHPAQQTAKAAAPEGGIPRDASVQSLESREPSLSGSSLRTTPEMLCGAAEACRKIPAAKRQEALRQGRVTATGIDLSATPDIIPICDQWDVLDQPGAMERLSQGGGFFGFNCSRCDQVPGQVDIHFKTCVNLTRFADEQVDNNVPVLDIDNPVDLQQYTGLFVKAVYVIPGLDIDALDLDYFCKPEYHKECQPGVIKVWKDVPKGAPTFRVTRPVIKYIFSVVVQMDVSIITDPEQLKKFEAIDGLLPTKVLVLERTKRDKTKVDGTAKVKSVLIYYPVPGGALVSNCTTVIAKSIPTIVAPIVSSFGTSGIADTVGTCKKTRDYIAKHKMKK